VEELFSVSTWLYNTVVVYHFKFRISCNCDVIIYLVCCNTISHILNNGVVDVCLFLQHTDFPSSDGVSARYDLHFCRFRRTQERCPQWRIHRIGNYRLIHIKTHHISLIHSIYRSALCSILVYIYNCYCSSQLCLIVTNC
jgi:hypothetical protein